MTKCAGLMCVAALVVCGGGSSDSGGTGGTPLSSSPTLKSFTDHQGTCVDGVYYAEAIASALTNGVGVLNIWETNSDELGTAWDEEHLLISSASGPFGEALSTALTRTADTGTSDDDETDGTGSTLFDCASTTQLLTNGVRIYDPEGALADCWLFGEQAACFADGTCSDALSTAGVSKSAELNGCTVL